MSEPLLITLRRGSAAEANTERALRRLEQKYALGPWLCTHALTIDEQAFPHSHPVLTLNTAHADDELMLLAELLHEQLHWFEEARAADRDRAIAATRQLHPNVPVVRPDGAGSEESTRLHLLVCTLEYDALKQLVGDAAARRTIEVLSRHHYRWVYRTVLDDAAPIRRLLRTHGLWPEALPAPTGEGG